VTESNQKYSYWVHLIDIDTYDIDRISANVGEVFDRENIHFNGKTVFLKPSFVLPLQDFDQVEMIVTNPVLIIAITSALLKRNAKTIFIGES
jgi:hypothetical protein